MSDRVMHCPFLNRADSRCSNHFSLDKLDSAFDHCFGQYQSCPTYSEMISERKCRSQTAGAAPATITANFPATTVYTNISGRPDRLHVNTSYVQIRLRPQHASIV